MRDASQAVLTPNVFTLCGPASTRNRSTLKSQRCRTPGTQPGMSAPRQLQGVPTCRHVRVRLLRRLVAFWHFGAATCPTADATQIAAAVMVIQISQNHRIRVTIAMSGYNLHIGLLRFYSSVGARSTANDMVNIYMRFWGHCHVKQTLRERRLIPLSQVGQYVV